MSSYGKFLVLISGLFAIIIVSAVLIILGHTTAAFAVSQFGTVVWMFSVLAYVVLLDSKKRWPDATFSQRLTAVVTFKKHP